jgi:hypothetical protein
VNDTDLTFFNKKLRTSLRSAVLGATGALVLSGCSLGGSGEDIAFCPVVEEGAVAFVKRPLQFDDDDPNNIEPDDLREAHAFRPGARLFIKGSLLPSTPAVDITSAVFSDPSFLNDDGELLYDVKDLAVSYDGTKLAFSMRAPEIEGADEEDQPKWNIWLYDFETCSLDRVLTSNATAESGHDIAPAFLVDDKIVFSSTRQQSGKAILLDEGKPQYSALDEELDTETFNLHTMDFDGQDIQQITFNQSHDLNPTLKPDGKIVFSRWDNAGQTRNNGMNLYEVNPDGTGLNYLYGRHSHDSGSTGTTVQYGRPVASEGGNIIVELREFQSERLSAVPTEVDVQTHIESDQRIDGTTGDGQSPLITGIDTTGELNRDGNYGSVFPFYDGTGRLLASWSLCRVRQTLADDAEVGAVNENPPEPCTQEKLDDTDNFEPAPPLYGLWIVDGNTQLPVVLAEEGQEFTDAVLIASRSRPTFIPESILDGDAQALAEQGFGALHIRSVYDIGGVDTSPSGIDILADPALTPPASRPVQFVRIEKAVSIPPDYVREFDNSAFGRSRAQLMREILGYVPVEPDGSVKVAVPADVAFALSLVDAGGQRLDNSERHQNWLTVRAGETIECAGCHTGASEVPHGRIDAGPAAVNQGALTTGLPFPNTEPALFADAGETMAEVFARINGVRQLSKDVEFEDDWTDDAIVAKAASYEILYDDLSTLVPVSTPACLTEWTNLCRTVINYAEHIQPLWSLPRTVGMADATCTSCHNNEDNVGNPMVPVQQLDLSNDPSTDEANHFVSYRNLLFTTVEQEVVGGILQPVLVATGEFERDEEGELILDGAGNPIEIFATVPVQPTMRTSGAKDSFRFFDKFEAGGTHAGYLTESELRMISEWLDIGAQYWNDPFKAPTN